MTVRFPELLAFALLFVGAAGCLQSTPDDVSMMPSQTSTYTSLYSFGATATDGSSPVAPLIAIGSMLYGTTREGGSNGGGTVFSITTSGSENVLWSFGAYGDGLNPIAGLYANGDTLVGTTENGGLDGFGAIFDVTTGGVEKVAHSFYDGGPEGYAPAAGLIALNGSLYGTAASGGRSNSGTVYTSTLAGHKVAAVYTFFRSSGAAPRSALLVLDRKLYGTTSEGGANGDGTVFALITTGTKPIERVLRDFGNADGAHPVSDLVSLGGWIYGTTEKGGVYHAGTVFKIKPDGEFFQKLHDFNPEKEGAAPEAGLTAVNGALYGTTHLGGTYNKGTLFSITTAGTETVVHTFGQGNDGADPRADLFYFNGTLYGTTAAGGTNGKGTVFSFVP